MQNLYTLLLTELPRIASVVEVFPEGQRDKVLDMLVDALMQTEGVLPANAEEVKTVVKKAMPKAGQGSGELHAAVADTDHAKKLSKLRAKIFEKNTSATVNDATDPVNAKLDELTTEDLSNIVFYQKGRTTPLSDMM